MTDTTNTASSSTATTTTPLVGPALLAHFEQHRQNAVSTTRAREVTAAGYVCPDGRPAYTAYYEAVIYARNGGYTAPTPTILAWLTLPGSAEPIGPAWSQIGHRYDRWHGEESLTAIQAWAKTHARAILPEGTTAADLWIADSCNTAVLGSVEVRAWHGDSATVYSVTFSHADRLPDGIEVCAHCGALTTHGDSNVVDGTTACSDCHSDAHACDCCRQLFTELTITNDGGEVCSECLNEHYSWCPVEQEWFDSSDTVYVYGGGYWTNDDNRYDTISRQAAEYLLEHGRLWLDCDGDYTAEAPDDDDDDGQSPSGNIGGCPIYGYHTDPHTVINVDKPYNTARFGAELEYKGSHPDGYRLSKAMDDQAILTEDGSVTGEVVTVCLTMGELRKRLATIAGALAGTWNDSSTGLHIHTDKRVLTPWQWYRLAQYTKQHAGILAAITGRNTWNYGATFQRTDGEVWEEYAKQHRHASGDRYSAWSIRSETVELRTCRASKTPSRILARLGMLQRLLAIGRLPDSAKPDAGELMGWLAQDKYIQAETRWEPGVWNYREAMRQEAIPSDLHPADRPDGWQALAMARIRHAATQRYRRWLTDESRQALQRGDKMRAEIMAKAHRCAETEEWSLKQALEALTYGN